MAEEGEFEEPGPLSIGERLREAREAKGLGVEDVASQTRIPIRHLDAIEREDWDALPAATYCIGFVRSYANAVGLDGAELGRELRDRLGPTRSRAPAPEYYEPADPARVPPRSLAIVAGGLLLVLVIVYAIWRSSLDDVEETAPAAAPPAADQAVPARPRPRPPRPQALAGQPVTLTAAEDAWLRIREGAGGPVLFEGILAPGQRFQVPPSAQRPVIRTGRPQVLRVAVGGRDLGALEPAERTVSDLSLRPEDLAARLRSGAAPPPAALPAPIPPQ